MGTETLTLFVFIAAAILILSLVVRLFLKTLKFFFLMALVAALGTAVYAWATGTAWLTPIRSILGL